MAAQRMELLHPCWRAWMRRMQRSTVYSQMYTIEAPGRTRLSMPSVNRRKPFTFGGTFAHVITFNFYRRMLAIDALRRLGVTVEGFGCPEEYLASLASA